MRAALAAWAQETDYDGRSDLVGPSLFFTWYRNFAYAHFPEKLGGVIPPLFEGVAE